MSGPVIDPRELRVSDDERSHVLTLLERATGRGLIDLEEYSRRSALVISARTRADLNLVLLDLPGLSLAGRSVADAGADVRGSGVPTPGYSGAPVAAMGPGSGVLELTGWGSRSYKGHWVVPGLIVIGGVGASTKLDFSQATLTGRRVVVQFRSNFGGSAEFILPGGGAVNFDGLTMRGGSVNNKVQPGDGRPVLELFLTGIKKGGSVSIRNPRVGLFSGW